MAHADNSGLYVLTSDNAPVPLHAQASGHGAWGDPVANGAASAPMQATAVADAAAAASEGAGAKLVAPLTAGAAGVSMGDMEVMEVGLARDTPEVSWCEGARV